MNDAINSRPVFSNNTNRSPFNGGNGEPPREHHEDQRDTPKRKKMSLHPSFLNYKATSAILLIGIIIIVAAILLFLGFGQNGLESGYVNKDDYQSVFVNVAGTSGGQAYFGKIVSIRNNYIVLDNVFYLESGQTSNQFSLNKLDCALYEPNDEMVINREQVDFWENLSSTSTVTKDINKWNADNLACPTASSSTSSTTSTPATTTDSSTESPSTSPTTSPATTPNP